MAGLYVHIPFCASRCIYCDFYSTTMLGERSRYLDALKKEISERRDEASHSSISTIYIGGGTPSQLSISQLSDLFDALYTHYNIDSDAEVTIECNPDDITSVYLSGLHSLPVNRLSLGIQSFDDSLLRFLHRRHDSLEAQKAVMSAQSSGFENISIDLMFGFPDEHISTWLSDIRQALSFHVPHISAYSLMYEDGTLLTSMKDRGELTPLDDETSLLMYSRLIEELESSGYEHYELSNFSLPGYSSRHNMSYWKGVPYLGFGAGAHSYDQKIRRWNVSSLKDYIKCVVSNEPYSHHEILSETDKYNEYVMTRLRTKEGIYMKEFQSLFPDVRYKKEFSKGSSLHFSSGNIVMESDHIHLTRQGLYISDSVMSDFFIVE